MLHSSFRFTSKLTNLLQCMLPKRPLSMDHFPTIPRFQLSPLMLSFPTIPSMSHLRFTPRPLMKRFYSSMDSRRPWRVTVPPNRRYNRPNPLFEGNNPLYAIIGINCGVWGVWQFANDRQTLKFMYQNFTISPFGIFREWRVHTAITSFFSHRDGWHLFSNMFTLYFFGMDCLMVLGGHRFLAMYMGAGLVSSACFALWPSMNPRSWPSSGRSSQFVSGLGASGAVCAVVTWSILTFPTRIVYLYAIVPIPAFIFGAGYLLNESYGLYTGHPNVSNIAHLGGAAFGALWFALKR